MLRLVFKIVHVMTEFNRERSRVGMWIQATIKWIWLVPCESEDVVPATHKSNQFWSLIVHENLLISRFDIPTYTLFIIEYHQNFPFYFVFSYFVLLFVSLSLSLSEKFYSFPINRNVARGKIHKPSSGFFYTSSRLTCSFLCESGSKLHWSVLTLRPNTSNSDHFWHFTRNGTIQLKVSGAGL